jgi:Cu(I)/Ag(I) efflux system membrane protein CusA/SilA
MLQKIITWSINNKIIVIFMTVLAIGLGAWSLLTTPIDAIPDLSDVQVIVYTEAKGQSPRIVEDQVTYPLTTSLVAVPGAKVVRGYSFFGYSLVYIIFKDGTDIYWARSRVLELLNYAQKRLPQGIIPTLGPDATGVGWVYEYALTSKTRSLAELRSLQDWYLKYQLTGIEGVSEVASIGGYVKQYQVTVDPVKLQSYGIPVNMVEMAIKNSNADVGGEVIEMAEAEYMVRGMGYIKSIDDIKNIPLKAGMGGKAPSSSEDVPLVRGFQGSETPPFVKDVETPPVFLGDVATVNLGPEMRRGVAELDGTGEVAGGVVIIRFGENALKVIDAVKKKLEIAKQGLPPDVKIVPVYDRSNLILRAIDNLRDKLLEEIIIVALVCILFLLHARSALVAVFTLPTAILMAFIVMRLQGISANIMSLSGIAIAIGAMVDAAKTFINILNTITALLPRSVRAIGTS